MVRNAGAALMTFLGNLDPILTAGAREGLSGHAFAHSMGNLVLESAIENWFLNGNGGDLMFELAILAAGDSR
jgi:hypothetical protein